MSSPRARARCPWCGEAIAQFFSWCDGCRTDSAERTRRLDAVRNAVRAVLGKAPITGETRKRTDAERFYVEPMTLPQRQ